MHDIWPDQEAKEHFSEILDASEKKALQLVTRRGVETAVIVNVSEWKRLNASTHPSLKSLLLSPTRYDLEISPNGKTKHRNKLIL